MRHGSEMKEPLTEGDESKVIAAPRVGHLSQYARWSDTEVENLKKWYLQMRPEAVAEKLGRTRNAILAKARQVGLTQIGLGRALPKKQPDEKSKRWGDAEVSALTKMYPTHSTRQIAEKLGRSRFSIMRAAIRFGCANKSTHSNASTLPIGTHRIESGFLYRKVANTGRLWTDWRRVSHLVWEEHYGEIPKGTVIKYRDGNRLNVDIGNLVLVSQSEHLRTINKAFYENPIEVRTALRLISSVKRRIRNMS